MKIAFIDPIPWDYSPVTPRERPLGGSQSGLCYLSANLAENGHEVALVNQIKSPGTYAGVLCPGFEAGFNAEFLNRYDAIIVLNGAVGEEIRSHGIDRRMIMWCQHDVDQHAVQNLTRAQEQAAWNGFVMVTDWALDKYHNAFNIPREKMSVKRNAIAPMFENVADKPAFFQRGAAPELVYSSTPFRGLDVLLFAFPMIRAAIPDCRLKVFSSMGVYQMSGEQDDYQVLYELCRSIEGGEYMGSVPQTELASAFLDADIMAYPNTFPELACIAVMEAMASDCLVMTSNLGALPETTAGHGFLLDVEGNLLQFANAYARLVIDTVNKANADPDGFEEHLARQKAFANKTYTWKARAQEWEQWLLTLML
jgi:glycosyltransferase involved in cell wall biosynthesis